VAVVLFAKGRAIPVLSLGDVTCGGRAERLFLGRLANFIMANCGAARPTCHGDGISDRRAVAARHPSQLYEAAWKGIVFAHRARPASFAAVRYAGRVLIIGAFAVRYALTRSFAELFRGADPQLGFLWGGLTMGMLLLASAAAVRHRADRHRIAPPTPERGAPRVMTPLERDIRTIVETEGPMTVSNTCSFASHPAAWLLRHAATRSARWDFVTAPEVSQMFGELLGAWRGGVAADGLPSAFV